MLIDFESSVGGFGAGVVGGIEGLGTGVVGRVEIGRGDGIYFVGRIEIRHGNFGLRLKTNRGALEIFK